MMDMLGGLWAFLNTLLNGPTLIVLAVVGAITTLGRAYFRSQAVDGHMLAEDWVFIVMIMLCSAALAFGIWLEVR